jgi:hypothetical protein
MGGDFGDLFPAAFMGHCRLLRQVALYFGMALVGGIPIIVFWPGPK